MNPFVYHIVSGHSFFTGAAFLLIALSLTKFSNGVAKRIIIALSVLGPALILLSAAAIPYWCYAIWGLSGVALIASRFFPKLQTYCVSFFIAATLGAVSLEIPYHIYWGVDSAESNKVTVVADSVTAGMGDNDKANRWPNQIQEDYGLIVQDLSHPGETAASAKKHVESNTIDSSIVIIEIGGNDLLGSTTIQGFDESLDALLKSLRKENRQLIMFELPLPPMMNEFGRIQRRLAWKYDVRLVPKRELLAVLAPKENTLDTIHLTQAGHDKMANIVWRLIRDVY